MNKDQPKPRGKDKDKPQDKGKLEDKDKSKDKSKVEDIDKDNHCSTEVPTFVLRSLKARVRPKPGPNPDQL